MARTFSSHHPEQQEEPQRLTAAAARSTDDDSARLRADLAAAAAELAYDTEPPAVGGVAMSVGAHSILAASDHSSGSTGFDAAPPALDASAQHPLRTSDFSRLANQMLLARASDGSARSSGTYGSAPSGQFNDSLIRSPEFDKISMDSTPVTAAAAPVANSGADVRSSATAARQTPDVIPPLLRTTDLSTTSTTGSNYDNNHNYDNYDNYDTAGPARAPSMRVHQPTPMYASSAASMDMSAGPSVSMYNGNGGNAAPARPTTTTSAPRASGRARVSSDLSSVQREMENNAFASSPVSEATYMNMRKTLDPEALLNGDVRNTANMAVLSSLRPVRDPFDLTVDPNLPGPDFQRRRAATTGAVSSMAVANGGGVTRSTTGRLTGSVPRGSTRSQRSWTVAGHAPPAPAILAHDPRGTFRTTTADTAQQIFASQQVRLQNKWSTDVWIYMKNAHPFLGICTAHRWHPYKKKDRALVLLTALLLAIFLCGLYATQQCCQTAADGAVAVVTTRSRSRALLSDHRQLLGHRQLAEDANCQPFGASCDAAQNLCTLGSSCVSGRCVPLEAKANTTQCSTTSPCPAGWRCSSSSNVCRPSASLVCYLPPVTTPAMKARGVSFAAEDGDEIATDDATAPAAGSSSGSNGAAPVDAISVIAKLIEYSKENNRTTPPPTTPTPTPTSSTPAPTTVAPVLNATSPNATTATPTTTPKATTVTSNLGVDSDVAVLDPAAINATVEKLMITLTKPTDGGVYSVSSTIPVAWEVKVLEGARSVVNTLRFRVDFSRDGQSFELVASDIESDSVLEASPMKYHYDWDLAFNESRACSSCVLRVCTQQDDASADPVCIRTDGATALTSTSTTSTSGLLSASTSSDAVAPKITFHIVRDVLECACGIKHAAFVTYSYLLALVFPVALLVFEQFVTFYQDSKVLGMFARRGGPKMPVVGFYAAEATKRGRVLLALVCVALIFACGMVAARITSARFMESTGDVVVLWVLMFLLVLVVGFIYCSAIYCAVFTVRWYRDEKTWNQQGGAADFAMMFDDRSNPTVLMQSHQAVAPSQQDPESVRSYQWPFGDMTNSSRSNYSTAVVTQRSGQAIV